MIVYGLKGDNGLFLDSSNGGFTLLEDELLDFTMKGGLCLHQEKQLNGYRDDETTSAERIPFEITLAPV